MSNTTIVIINADKSLQARWRTLIVNDIEKTITATYSIEKVTSDGIETIEMKTHVVSGAGYERWDETLGTVIRGAIAGGIKANEGIQ